MPGDLDQLIEMGWMREYAEQALEKSNHQGLEAALDWIESHPPDEISGQESHSEANQMETSNLTDQTSTEPFPQPKSFKCEDCGKALRTPKDVNMHVARTGHINFNESSEEVKPLTPEERQAMLDRVQELMRVKKLQREEADKAKLLEDEKQRRSQGKFISSAKVRFQEDQMKRDIAEQKRQKNEDKIYRERLLAAMAKEREEKLAAAAASKTEVAVTPPGQPLFTTSAVKSEKDFSTCQLSIRTPTGPNLKQTFSADDKLDTVVKYIRENWPQTDTYGSSSVANASEIQLQINFPVRKFGASEMSMTLSQLGLCPSSVLVARRQ